MAALKAINILFKRPCLSCHARTNHSILISQTILCRYTSHKTAFLTGGTKGIGLRTLEQLMEFKHMKFIIATRDKSQFQKLLNSNEELTENQTENENSIDIIDLDITSDNSIISATKHIQTNYDNIDILINNAIIDNGSKLTSDNLETTFNTNYYGNINLTEAMIPLLSTMSTTKDSKNMSVYASRIIFPFNRDCALNKLQKPLQNELMNVSNKKELDDMMRRFMDDCVNKKWDNFGWIMNTYLMSIVGLNMYGKMLGNEYMKDDKSETWVGSYCMDKEHASNQNGTGLCKLSTMLIDKIDRDKNGYLWGGFFKAATNIDVDEDDGYVDEVELEVLDWVNPRNTISWDTMLDDLMFSNVTGEDQ